MSNGNSAEASTSPSPAPSSIGNNAPKFGTLVPNRVFVGGISGNTTEQDLLELFTKYGKVKATKVISDRAGVSKGYGFVTFETEEEARKLTQEADNIMLKDRKLNIAPAIKKQVNDLGYIKPYSPRLVDGPSAATVLGANGTVFFGNGTTYAYTNPVPMLASPSDYHQTVTGVPTHTAAAHPTFPPQVHQAGAPTAVSAAPQLLQHQAKTRSIVQNMYDFGVGGTPAPGYPTQFVYPQTMYFPQQFQQFQTTALQPQWPTSPQWRWVSPNAYPQVGPEGGYPSAGGRPETGSPGGETPPTDAQRVHRGVLAPPLFQTSSPLLHCCFPPPFSSSASSPVSSSHHHPHSHSAGPSVTTATTTTTAAAIGGAHGAPLVLEIRPLVGSPAYRGLPVDTEAAPQTTPPLPEETPRSLTDSLPLPGQNGASTPVNHQGVFASPLPTSNSSPSEDSTTRASSKSYAPLEGQDGPRRRGFSRSADSLTSSPDLDIVDPSQNGGSTPSPPLWAPGSKEEGISGYPLTGWCPQHNSHPQPHTWSQSAYHSSSLSSPRGKRRMGSPPRMCRSPLSQRGYPTPLSASGDSQKVSGCRKDSLIGKPFLKMGATTPTKALYGGLSQNPVVMVPWYQYGPPVGSPWVTPWPPFLAGNCFLMPHSVPSSPCSFHPSGPGTPAPIFPPTPSPSHNSHHPFPLHENMNGSHFSRPAAPPSSHSTSPPPLSAGFGKRGSSPAKTKVRSNPPWWLGGSVSPATSSWIPFPGYNSSHSRRGSFPFTGEDHPSPLRCLQRLTRLPDDKCALLPISPPLTPYQGDVVLSSPFTHD